MDINKVLNVTDLIQILVETKTELIKVNASFKSLKDDIALIKFMLEKKDLKQSEAEETKEPDAIDGIIKNLIGDMGPEDILKMVNNRKGK